MAENLKDSIEKIHKRLDELVEKKEVKKWNLSWWKRLTGGQVKRNWVLVCYIQENKGISFIKVPIDEGVIMLNGIPHTINSDEIMIYKNKPFIIVPSWSIKPFSPAQNVKETNENGNNTLGWEFIMNYIKKTEIKAAKGAGMIIWIIVGLIVIGGGYYLIKNGGFF